MSGGTKSRKHRLAAGIFLVLVLPALAIVSARSFAGSSNDGSRLATVESLVDYHTLAIDRSIFVPPASATIWPPPYPPRHPLLPYEGTCDKVLVHGHFYSHQPPVPALFMAGFYQTLQWAFGLQARQRADLFCYSLTLASSGLAYVLAGWGLYQLARIMGLAPGLSLGLTASLALASVALPYARHVNSHVVLLALALWLFGFLHQLLTRHAQPLSPGRLLLIGTLAGLAYAVEQAAGGLLLAGSLGVAALVRPRTRVLILTGLAALPWVLLHHGIVYGFAHTLRPVGAVPQFFRYENSSFDETNLTGLYLHTGLGDFLLYAARLLVGSRGFLLSNVPLWLALLAAGVLLPSPRPTRPVLLLACAWSVGTWLIYALLSNNYAGVCCSVRWFVPLLAPGYYLLALLLRDHPAYRPDFLLLSAWGAVLASVMWYYGPWCERVPWFWPFQGAVLGSWVLYRLYRHLGPASPVRSRPEPRALSTVPS